jgi:hypothetical protein
MTVIDRSVFELGQRKTPILAERAVLESGSEIRRLKFMELYCGTCSAKPRIIAPQPQHFPVSRVRSSTAVANADGREL